MRIVRYKPVENNAIAVGLENGEIQIWNLLGSRKCPQATLEEDLTKDNLADRVLDLSFSSDSQYLYSSHGSGKILQWPVGNIWDKNDDQNPNCNPILLEPTKSTNEKPKPFDFAIYSLTLVGKEEKYLAFAGQYNTLCLTERTRFDRGKCELVDNREGSDKDYIRQLDKANKKPYLLASVDTQGQITIWNLKKCLQDPQQCQELTWVDRWQENQEQKSLSPLYSVALSDNGCYLVTGGQLGQVKLWSLDRNGKRASPQPILLYPQFWNRLSSRKPINTVDIKVIDETIYILSGGDETQVKLNTYNRKKLDQKGCD